MYMSTHMSTHMCMHMCMHISTHTFTHMCMHMSTQKSICMSKHMDMHTSTHMPMHVPIHMPIHMSTHLYHVFAHVCTHVCAHVAHVYIHVYTQLTSLSGNAMTTTVVGAVMMSALLLTYQDLQKRWEKTRGGDGNCARTPTDHTAAAAVRPAQVAIIGEGELKKAELDLGTLKGGYTPTKAGMALMFDVAARSRRMCESEGRWRTSASPIVVCKQVHARPHARTHTRTHARTSVRPTVSCGVQCGHTCSMECAEKPEHEYEPYKQERLPALQFARRLLASLPMELRLGGVDVKAVGRLRPDGIDDELWAEWFSRLGKACAAEYRFVEVKEPDQAMPHI